MYILIHSLIEIVLALAPKMSFHFEGQDMLKTLQSIVNSTVTASPKSIALFPSVLFENVIFLRKDYFLSNYICDHPKSLKINLTFQFNFGFVHN